MENLEFTKSISSVEVNKDGQIRAYLTTFENTDVVGDVIKTGALDKYIQKFNSGQTDILRMLFQHNRSEIIGKWDSLEIDEKGVIGTGTIFEEVSRGKDVKSLLMRGVLNSVSIGFRATEYRKNSDGGNDFYEIELIETSVVDFPANPEATILSVKSDDGVVNIRMLEKILRDAGLSIKESKTVASVAKTELKTVCDEQKTEEELVNALRNFKLNT